MPAKKPAKKATKPKRGRGRPSKYRPEFCDIVVEQGRKGASLAVMARECGVIRETMYAWASKHPEFAEALTWARELSLAWWEEQGQQFLLDRSESENGSSWSRRMNFGLYKLHMVNRFPQEWRDKQEIAHSHQLDQMSTDELLDLAASLSRKIGGA